MMRQEQQVIISIKAPFKPPMNIIGKCIEKLRNKISKSLLKNIEMGKCKKKI